MGVFITEEPGVIIVFAGLLCFLSTGCDAGLVLSNNDSGSLDDAAVMDVDTGFDDMGPGDGDGFVVDGDTDAEGGYADGLADDSGSDQGTDGGGAHGETDPCIGIVCDNPPLDYCVDANFVCQYDQMGLCNHGTCEYECRLQPCQFGCSAGQCQSCIPQWRDTTSCNCNPTQCLSCDGTKHQRDGCGAERDVSCSLEPAGCPGDQVCGQQNQCVIRATNPVIASDAPDPHVLRIEDDQGHPVYYLVHTVHNSGDIPIYTSVDLIHWTLLPMRAFNKPRIPGNSLDINGGHFCSVWAPHINKVSNSIFLLGFSASRFASTQAPCPGYNDDGGVYLASSSTPTGPFALSEHSWEPFPSGANPSVCSSDIRLNIPHSVDYSSVNCQGGFCHQIVRLDSDVFRDPQTGRWWLAYSWFTNSPPMVPWEESNHGEHLSITELDSEDPFAVKCDSNVAQIYAANPHDSDTLSRLASYCSRCGEMLSFTRGRFGQEFTRDGFSWGVTEGASLFRRGGWVYLLISGSLWDSPYYHVYWVAAHSVEELAYTNSNRLVGRYLVPSQSQAFGHGAVVMGPDGQHWYFVHHHLDSSACENGDCLRDIWVSPIEFEDRGDGLGDVYIRARFPAEQPQVEVVQ